MLFFALCAGEAGIFLILLSLYRAATKPDVWSFVFSLPGIVFFCSFIIVAFSVGWAILILKKCAPSNKKQTYMALGMNLVMLLLALGSMEILTRLLSKQTTTGETVLGVDLRPRHWSQVVAQYKKVIEDIAHKPTYLVHDPILGWTVGASRSTRTGQQLSSAEGLRSPRLGMSFADVRARHSKTSEQPASIRVALVGDSMTFGYEVRCEETWGHALEGLLQPHTQVLNFGVSLYGLNQVFLRYEKDVRPWRPQIVVIGVTSEMIRRIDNIYTVLMYPQVVDWPFLRPRLVIKNDMPSTINYPVPDPAQIVAYTSINELPHLSLDDHYRPLQWERGSFWLPIEKSYLFRFMNSLRPPTEAPLVDIDANALQMSELVLSYLIREVLNDGAIPLLVDFPYKHQLNRTAEPGNTYVPFSDGLLRRIGVEYYDATACLLEVGTSAAYMEGGHYSPVAHAHLAQCLEPVLAEEISRLKRS